MPQKNRSVYLHFAALPQALPTLNPCVKYLSHLLMHATAWDWTRVNTAVDKDSDCSLTAPLMRSHFGML